MYFVIYQNFKTDLNNCKTGYFKSYLIQQK
jgi:hypothetical protein